MKPLLTCSLLFTILFSSAQTRQIALFQTDNFGGPSKSVDAGNVLFFTAWDSIHGRELWRTDGTAAGTYMVSDINPGLDNGLDNSFEFNSLFLNGVLYFRANDGLSGFELWRSDGTSAGTYLLKDLQPGIANSSFGSLTAVNNIFYFVTNTGQTLWKCNGTSAGTLPVKSFSFLSNLYAYNGVLYFAGDLSNTGQELWRSNGSVQGTYLLKDLNGVLGASLPCNFHATDNMLYFMAQTSAGWELWKTNGNNAGTVMVKDINPGGAHGVMSFYNTAYMTHVGDTLFFRANDGINGYQLWKTDGSNSGTVRLTSITNQVDPYCYFPVAGNKLLFNQYSDEFFHQYDLSNGQVSLSGYPFATYMNSYREKALFDGNKMYFAGKDTVYGCEMWQSDGTVQNTLRIQETHLTDNWTSSQFQGFQSIAGLAGDYLVFMQSRTITDTRVPLFSFDISSNAVSFPPGIIAPVRRNNTDMHLVWNRVKDASEYRIRYRELNTNVWTTRSSAGSYKEFNNLSANTSYEFQIRSICNGIFSPWSDVVNYNTGVIPDDYLLHIIADRSESSTVHRIYWQKTQQIAALNLRYRKFGTTSWTPKANTDGMLRITGLIPGTLYEFQYRPVINGNIDLWYPAYLYFVSGADAFNPVSPLAERKSGSSDSGNYFLYPNPAADYITISGYAGSYTLISGSGKTISEGFTNGNLDIRDIGPGHYFIKLEENVTELLKFIKY